MSGEILTEMVYRYLVALRPLGWMNLVGSYTIYVSLSGTVSCLKAGSDSALQAQKQLSRACIIIFDKTDNVHVHVHNYYH